MARQKNMHKNNESEAMYGVDLPEKSSNNQYENSLLFLNPQKKYNKEAIKMASQAVGSYTSVASRDTYQDFESNISVRDQFTRRDYEYFRPYESLPQKPEEIIQACRRAYRQVGIIRNVIDLMADFGAQGARLIHPNKKIQDFYRGWWKRVGGNRICERFLNLFYREGVAILKRSTGRINKRQKEEIVTLAENGKVKPDSKLENSLRISKSTIPVRYNFLNPLSLKVPNEELTKFVGKYVYHLKINPKLRNSINYPKTKLDKQLVDMIPSDVRQMIQKGAQEIPLDSDKICVAFYKKDDWQTWADPMIYAILKDVIMLEKMKLADLAALDGAISQVRIWKLGDIDNEIFPNAAAFARLEEILMSNTGGGAFDLLWGPELSVEEYKTDVYNFLGKAKYEPVLNSIYDGLGVPPTLTGSVHSPGMTNNFISLKTLIQRLDYGRDALKDFWSKEIELVRQGMGFKEPAKLVFDNMVLSDEAAEKKLLLDLVDRDIISLETLLERFGELPEFENLRLRREEKERDKGKMKPKTSPWHRPEKIFEMMKIALQKGYITPEQAGIEDEDDSFVDLETPFDKQLKNRDNDKKVTDDKGGGPIGRPKNSKDKEKRYRNPKPLGSAAAYLTTLMWARSAMDDIAGILNPAFLHVKNKESLRSLSSNEKKELENLKFAALSNTKPFSQITKESVHHLLSTPLSINKQYQKLYTKLKSSISNKKEEITLEDTKMLQASTYSIINSDEEMFVNQ